MSLASLGMATFYLIRHGKRDPGPGDPPLNSQGQAMAQRTAKAMASRPIQGVFSSPFLRARQTATAIAQPHGLHVIIDERLRERANWGDLPRQSYREFMQMWAQSDRDRTLIPRLGDSAQAAGMRLESFIFDIYAKCVYGSGEIHESRSPEFVAVAHGGIISDFLINVFPMDILTALYPTFSIRLSDSIQECSITTVGYDGLHYNLQEIGSTKHLNRRASARPRRK